MGYLSAMIRHRFSILLLILFGFQVLATAQTEAEFEAAYKKRIQLEIIDGVYIPADLEDAFSELNRLSDPAGLKEFKTAPEDSIRRRLHFGLGRWILINWGFEDGSRFSHFLKQKGVSVPDDMVEITILAWHRKLNGRPLELELEIAKIEERLARQQAKRDSLATKIIIEKRPHKE